MSKDFLDRNLALEAVRVTEAAALSSSLHMGRGDEKAADQAAVNAMRDFLNNLVIDGTVVIGEGERDKAPMLYIGEKVGKGGPKVDIALDPLEGTTITAKGGENALSVLAMAEEGGFLHAPDIYMHKIAYGKKYQDLEIDPESPANEIVQKFSDFADMNIKNIVVCILDRPRHQELINKVRQTGARIKLISDGDVSAVIATSFEDSGVDMYMGIGGSPEGVLAAAALRCIGGRIYSKLVFSDESEKKRAADMGIKDANKIYTTNDLASGDVMFSATGVTNGTLLQGVLIKNNIATTQSVVMRSKTKTLRYVNASHNLTIKDIIT
ncbi:MAG: class II fructose-bisphosphatase [Pelagibacteraceae bacterium]|jgi:fructose-1,6-bisphosphatase II / sedoheptulose-1,7-bisphosphatase|nr:class II fructose-bisphosphatase [Pelagibacteraceae bacterium]HJL58534.1 class II fructose-bisphosphatase [Alphaproteobacteria bacterium]MBO6467255.1 class II fructose-bisphosphatase [Pelagibacteraceae bacterium]MBO6470025.1 class II fructose-bisphosphatase [Pelagibacteraceae bacterium]MBO6471170.1 class II fructose-bisphosphatase [Pelagibacteraceae bacterium]|tara:strand:+ start:866 stop:1837 length:972 start_codon:yes stop_codon:yes gene_type:complete